MSKLDAILTDDYLARSKAQKEPIKKLMLELLAPYDYSEFDEVTSAIADIRKKVEGL